MNKNYGKFGLAVQTKQGVAATAPTTTFFASADSNGMAADKTINSINLTKGNPVAVSSYVDNINTTFDVTTLSFPALIGQLLYAACGDVATEPGSNSLYTHTVSCAENLPFLTVFEQKGSESADITTMEDAKLNTLTVTAEGNNPLSVAVNIPGCKMGWKNGTSTWSGPAFDIEDGYFGLAGAEVLFTLVGDTPVAVPLGIILSKIEIGINNNVEGKKPLGNAAPSVQVEKTQTVTISIEGETDSTEQYREALTGSKTGALVSSQVITGAVQITFVNVADPNQKLIVKIPAIPWKCDAMGVSTDGGAFSLGLSTDGALDTGNGAATFVLTNEVASYKPTVQAAG